MRFRRVLTRVASKVQRRRRAQNEGRAGRSTRPAEAVRIAYRPDRDGRPDPGEVVWTWVPYEDDPNQGKDRPVVVIGSAGDQLAVVPLSSRGPEGRPDPAAWVSVGSGRWDGEGRTSYANVDRVLQVAEDEVRREGATLDRARFDALVAGVRRHHADIR